MRYQNLGTYRGRHGLRTRLAIRLHLLLERFFPERRVFLRSDSDTRFIRLRPATQLLGFAGASVIVAWAIIATSILIMDSIGAGNFRDQAKRDQRTYEARLNALSAERDSRAAEARAAQDRFDTVLAQVSVMQSELLRSETRREELETGIEVMQNTLRRTMRDRDSARAEAERLAQARRELPAGAGPDDVVAGDGALAFLNDALNDTARERDKVLADAETALQQADEMAHRIRLMQEENDAIFQQLEDAMAISVEPLERMFSAAGLNTETLLDTVRRGYSGLGGPLTPLSFSTRGKADISPDVERANRLLDRMDRLNLYRIAAEKAPFSMPVKNAFRYTSGYGMRWGRMHKGTDFAAPHGTPIYATADGVVTHAGWLSGYGRLVKIEHAFGIETRFAHNSKLHVKVGQRVSRGQKISDMGNTGRSTGTHLHYEVRVSGKAVNPMTYIKAARDVF